MLFDEFSAIAARLGDTQAIDDGRCRLNFSSLQQQALKIATALCDNGVAQGDRVAMILPNSSAAVALFWGIQRLGAIAVWLNEQTPAAGLGVVLADASPVLIVTDNKWSTLARDAVTTDDALDATAIVLLDSLRAASESAAPAQLPAAPQDHNRVAVIVYTSGSTGKPKGVALTHKNLSTVGRMAADEYRTVVGDTYLMLVPLHYIHGLMILMAMHLRGTGIILAGSFMFPGTITKQLVDTGVTGFSGVPYHLQALVTRGALLDTELPNLRWIGITGGRCAPALLREISAAHPHVELHISYGQTECSPRITALAPHKILSKPDSVGEVPVELEVSFLDDEGRAVAEGEVGELVVSGPTVMAGYWNAPEATAAVIDAEGRLHTGDLAWRDDEGDVFIKGRVKAMIKTAGERIFPEELEAIIEVVPGVQEVAILGVEDPLYGQRVEACVVLDDDSAASVEQLRKAVLQKVPLARSPRHYRCYEALPKTANGKIDKPRLLEQLRQLAKDEASKVSRGTHNDG